jgi:hypothetical protein
MLLDVLIYAALLPFSVAAVVALAARRLRLGRGVAWAVSIAIAYVAAHFALDGYTSLLAPREAVNWLPHAVLLAAGIVMLQSSATSSLRRWATVLSAALCLGLALRLLANSAYVTLRWSLLEKLAYVSLLFATFALTWLLLSSARDDEHPRLRSLLSIIVAAGAAVVIALSGVFVYGELCGVVAAALTGAAASAVADDTRYPRIRVPFFPLRAAPSPWMLSGAAGVVTCSLGGLIVLASFYGELRPANAALLFLSLVIAGGRLPRFVMTSPPLPQAAIRIGLCLVPLAIAVARAVAATQAEMSASPYAVN